MNIISTFGKDALLVADDYLDIAMPTTPVYGGAAIWVIIASILAIVGGILVYFLFINKKDEPKGKFLKNLKDFLDFKVMWIEKILKILYYIATIFIILFSFALISSDVLSFFVCLIFGPVIVRLVYEGLMMFIMIWRNTKDIAENTEKPM